MTTNNNQEIAKVGLIQMACAPSTEENMAKAVDQIREAARKGAQIVCLQELFRSQYFCQVENTIHFSLAESLNGPTATTLRPLAKELGLVLIAPIFEERSTGIYHNTALVIDADGSLAGKYRKMHIPNDPGFSEKFYFTPGDTGFQTFNTKYGKVGVLICWDQWFPEAARLTALSGAQILFYPTAIGFQPMDAPYAAKQANAWLSIQKAHSIANGVFTVAVNRVGLEGDIQFWGQSFVSDPFGEVLYQAPDNVPETVVVDCDLSLIEETRQGWPFLRDRRIDAYQNLNRIYIDPNDD